MIAAGLDVSAHIDVSGIAVVYPASVGECVRQSPPYDLQLTGGS